MTGKNRIHQPWSAWDALHRAIDAAAIGLGLAFACRYTAAPAGEQNFLAAAAAILLYHLIAEFTGLYLSWRGVAPEREIACSALTWCYVLPVLLLLGHFSGRLTMFPRETLFVWFVVAPSTIASVRIVIRLAQHALRMKGYNTRGFAIVGANELGFEVARKIENAPHMGLKLVGLFDDRPAARRPDVPADVGLHLGNVADLLDLARAGKVHMIYITFPMRAEERIRSVLAQLSDTTASVYLVPDFFVFELLHSRWTNIGGLPAVSVFENPFYGVDGLIKRAVDLCLATLFLLVAAIPMFVIAAAIKLTSRGPVFFRQQRYGLDGRTIRVWKFRSMRVCEDGPQVAQATAGDPRVTKLGAFLRKTSLDEVPQLFNVIEGSMSLVGPRPHANTHNEAYRKMIQGYMLRHKVKPGITGLAQVNGWRGETDTLYKMQKRVEFDHQYIRDWSPWLDVKILCKTVVTVLSRQNAY